MKHYELNQNKFLSVQELNQLNLFVQNTNNRDALIIELALNTGARAMELLNLTRSDVKFETQEVYIRGLKGSKDRAIPLKPSLFKKLMHYVSRLNGDIIFDISYQRLDQIWYKYTPNPDKSFKSTRHTFAIELYKRTKDLKLVQTVLGHRSIINTMIYADYVYSTEEMRRIL